MAVQDDRFGEDLRLFRDVERIRSSRDPGNDLATQPRSESGRLDLATIKGSENLVQALLLRFSTPVGELAALGHPAYGSRLHELIGEANNETNRNRAKMFVLQTLAGEPRVKEVQSVSVTRPEKDRARMDIAVSLLAIDGDTPLNLVFPFFVDGGVAP